MRKKLQPRMRFYLVGLFATLLLVVLFLFSSKNEFFSSEPIGTLISTAETDTPDNCIGYQTITYYYYPEYNPDAANNKVGMYVYAENRDFIKLASELVNSNGGDWGYVLIPYNIHDRDYTKWRGVFSLLYEEHLIPIIQLNDYNENSFTDDIRKSADFLDDMVWPVKQRYISVFNEPNDAKFWRERIDPAEYARVLDQTIAEFKDENEDFFMLNGALNASAPNTADYMDSFDFMQRMQDEVPDIFTKLDGWASHSYPQPNFSGSPYDVGRWSIRAYDSELNYLQNVLGVDKDLPVFITETGWAHAEGENYAPQYLSSAQVGENMRTAYQDYWLDDTRVQAVIPFTIWYEPPFDHFSWVDKNKNKYAQFSIIEDMPKIKGEPQSLVAKVLKPANCPAESEK